jgi:hypothetical protein
MQLHEFHDRDKRVCVFEQLLDLGRSSISPMNAIGPLPVADYKFHMFIRSILQRFADMSK